MPSMHQSVSTSGASCSGQRSGSRAGRGVTFEAGVTGPRRGRRANERRAPRAMARRALRKRRRPGAGLHAVSTTQRAEQQRDAAAIRRADATVHAGLVLPAARSFHRGKSRIEKLAQRSRTVNARRLESPKRGGAAEQRQQRGAAAERRRCRTRSRRRSRSSRGSQPARLEPAAPRVAAAPARRRAGAAGAAAGHSTAGSRRLPPLPAGPAVGRIHRRLVPLVRALVDTAGLEGAGCVRCRARARAPRCRCRSPGSSAKGVDRTVPD